MHHRHAEDRLGKNDIDEVKLSFGRCLLSTKGGKPFLELFYELFIDSHPDFKVLFSKTDIPKQVMTLKNGLNMAIMYAGGDIFVAKDVLEKISHTHSRAKLNIKPEYYPFWVDSLLRAIKIKDDRCDEALEAKWRQVLQVTVDFIVSGY